MLFRRISSRFCFHGLVAAPKPHRRPIKRTTFYIIRHPLLLSPHVSAPFIGSAVSQWQMRNIHFSPITYSLNFFRSSSLVTLATKFGVFRYKHTHTKPHSVYSTAYPKEGIFISSHFPCFFPSCPRYILLILHRCCRISFWWLRPFFVRLIIVYSPFARSHP